MTQIANLEENMAYFSEINSFSLIDEDHFVISTSMEKHYIFDKDMDLQYFISSESLETNFCLYSSFENYLYALNLRKDFSKYELVQIHFDEIVIFDTIK